MKLKYSLCLLPALLWLSGCTFNPFDVDNRLTGNATGTAIGAGAGVGAVALAGGSKPLMLLGGILGGGVGYYYTTLRYDSGPIIRSGGQVYVVGSVVGIYVPTDNLFEPNTDDLLPQASPVLDSVATVLSRYPDNNIIISGNTSGFYRSNWERKLSEKRAAKVAAYLWNEGINQFRVSSSAMRKLQYVGYGDYFPISNDYTNNGIRTNSRIQIVSYPSACDLQLDKRHVAVFNVGAVNNDDDIVSASRCTGEDC
ncbi:MAG TPA: OmpA family protein [Gammaproteobacteria bacterium]|jgi:hypothetical protein|nr:OmpA family protein [Gammaproteobacteria bacterium]